MSLQRGAPHGSMTISLRIMPGLLFILSLLRSFLMINNTNSSRRKKNNNTEIARGTLKGTPLRFASGLTIIKGGGLCPPRFGHPPVVFSSAENRNYYKKTAVSPQCLTSETAAVSGRFNSSLPCPCNPGKPSFLSGAAVGRALLGRIFR